MSIWLESITNIHVDHSSTVMTQSMSLDIRCMYADTSTVVHFAWVSHISLATHTLTYSGLLLTQSIIWAALSPCSLTVAVVDLLVICLVPANLTLQTGWVEASSSASIVYVVPAEVPTVTCLPTTWYILLITWFCRCYASYLKVWWMYLHINMT